MYSYLHRYHAGCYADVHKHLALIALLTHLQKKTTPFCVLDTHAGEGIYDLQCEESQKNKEYLKGIEPLLTMPNPPLLVQTLLAIIQSNNETYQSPSYPGSPAIIKAFLRTQDNAICIDGHHQTFVNLQKHFRRERNMHLHQRDAFESLTALIPFKEKRGLVFVDPSYEVKSDYQNITQALIQTYSRFSQGIYALWYPLLEPKYHEKILSLFEHSPLPSVWHCEWNPYPNEEKGMLGSGIVIINPPWKMDELLNETFAQLNIHAYPEGHFFHRWLKNAAHA